MTQHTTSDFLQAHKQAETFSRYIEVLLHASETPLTDKDLKKHLMIGSNELQDALALLQVFPERLENLSQALLETLSIIAYQQPVTRSDIEQVRGVAVSSNILRQLFDKGWIVENGHKDTLGRPALLHTTQAFLDAFGLDSLDRLPPLPDLDHLKIRQ